ncbi:MAG: BamA/TamA family outer membrane protein [Candidatus Latescibacteria bacterium]|nr:BamA/TamA family outer membrane protein [Candidatus Latescibacterota bacterium]
MDFRLPQHLPYTIAFLSVLCIQSSPMQARGQVTQVLIDEIRISGNSALSRDSVVELTGLLPGRPYTEQLLQTGIEHLIETYASNGFFRVSVIPSQPDFSVDSTSISLTLTIEEGALARIKSIELTGNRAIGDADILTTLNTTSGQPFQQQRIEQDIDNMLTQYERIGYPYCRVEIDRFELLDGGIAISLEILEGPLVRIDGFRIEGNTHTRESVITRELRISKGSPFNQKALTDGHERLLKLGLFNQVSEPTFDLNPQGDGAVVVIHVEEGRTSSIDGILGYIPGISGRSGFLTGSFALSLKNMAGTGRRMQASWIRRDPLSSDIRVRYEEPWMFGYPVGSSFELGQTQQDSSFTATELAVRLTMPIGSRVKGHIELRWRRVIPDSVSAHILPANRAVIALFGLTVDTRDDILNPRRGSMVRLDGSYGLRWNSATASFTPQLTRTRTSKISIDVEQYFPVVGRQVAALALHVVDIRSGEISLPASQQFRFGGTRTLRGYREYQFQGAQVLWTNLEYRVLLSRRSRFFVFFDAGYYEQGRTVGRLLETKISSGLGLRLESSIGIVGIDYAVGEEDSILNGKVHFGLRNEF